MSLSPLRIALLLLLIAIVPLTVSCGHESLLSEEEADAFAEGFEQELVQADLKPVEQPELETAGDPKASDGDSLDEGADEEIEDVDVVPS